MALDKTARRLRIKRRIRKVISGTSERPRMSVFRSNKQIYAQIVNDLTGETLLSASSKEKEIASQKVNKIDQAKLVVRANVVEAIASGIRQTEEKEYEP